MRGLEAPGQATMLLCGGADESEAGSALAEIALGFAWRWRRLLLRDGVRAAGIEARRAPATA